MRAVEVAGGRGGPEALQVVKAPRPRARAGEIVIRLHAAGVNKPDVLQRMGAYPPPANASPTLGLEGAGEVVEVGEGAPRWKVGDRVTALLPGGGYAEYARCDARHALPAPAGFTWAEAAALPETVFTVWTNVFQRGRLQVGETLLLHGATGGIGLTAIALAKAAGARVITTSRGADKAKQAEAQGAEIALDSTAGDWVQAVRDAGGADVVLDMVAGDFVPKNLRALNDDGRAVVIGVQGGGQAQIDVGDLLRRRLTLTGSTLRARTDEVKAAIAAEVEATVWPWLAQGRFRPTLEAVLPLEEAAEAHRRMETGGHLGKLVLALAQDAQERAA
ncbi:MAG: NAD(P)H-quinone oxidoreductase [Caulobacteraceae bacterium]|nr:NAD(P)H-quinone oxidoreductase [Caulobacter sp.]